VVRSVHRRGLDYYTGTVYEASSSTAGFRQYLLRGALRQLAGEFIRRDLPGVGMSIGLSRLFAKS